MKIFSLNIRKKTVKSNFIPLKLILIRIFEAWQLWIEQVNVELVVFRSCELPTSERFCSNKDLTAASYFCFHNICESDRFIECNNNQST